MDSKENETALTIQLIKNIGKKANRSASLNKEVVKDQLSNSIGHDIEEAKCNVNNPENNIQSDTAIINSAAVVEPSNDKKLESNKISPSSNIVKIFGKTLKSIIRINHFIFYICTQPFSTLHS